MSLKIIKFFKKITVLSSINILCFSLASNVVYAEIPNDNNRKSSKQEQLKFSFSSNFKITQFSLNPEQKLISSSSNGEPFLRRQPTPGQPKFKPKPITPSAASWKRVLV